jgi:1,5-anhydro-D-fructose reductase (1,5-anhydro-D-mannitol-forming)
MSAERLNWGVLGCGNFTRRRILPAVAASCNARVVALQRRKLSDAETTAREAGVPKAYASRAELLADKDVQAVFVGSHHAGHIEDVMAAAAAGKPVLCEKPLGLNADECSRMVAACSAAGVKLFVGHCGRYKHAVETARKQLADGTLGALQGMRVYYGNKAKTGVWRRDCRISGGGALLDLGPHVLDAVRYISGQDAVTVMATVEPQRDVQTGRCEDRARAILKMTGGALVSVEFSSIEPLRNGFEVHGSLAHLIGNYVLSNMDSPVVRLERLTGDPDPIVSTAIPMDPREIYQLQVEDVSLAILDPGHTPRCATGEDGVKTLRIIDAIYASSECAKAVAIG